MTAMPSLVVCPLREATARIQSGSVTHAVSLVDPDTEIVHRAPCHLVLAMEDSLCGAGSPDAGHVAAMVAFIRTMPPDARLLVHCHAGIGRSPAAAIGMLAAIGHSPEDAVAKVAAIRPFMMPNKAIIGHFDDILGLGGSLRYAAEAWMAARPRTGLVITG